MIEVFLADYADKIDYAENNLRNPLHLRNLREINDFMPVRV